MGEQDPLKEILGSKEFQDIAIKQALKQKTFDKSERERIDSMIKEFLDAYVVVGYDLKGQLVVLTGCNSDLQRDALQTAIMKAL